jgi:hypothetical protein
MSLNWLACKIFTPTWATIIYNNLYNDKEQMIGNNTKHNFIFGVIVCYLSIAELG